MRRLTREERELWRQLRRSVRPLRATPAEPAQEAEPGPTEEAIAATPSLVRPTAVAVKSPRPAMPPLTTLEERARRRLSRGLTRVEGRIDLHGMSQDQAFGALIGFLRQTQSRGAKLVLVITGKGRQGEDGRGVLRHSVPAWLARPEFRGLVLGFEEAGPRHGGAGALYVRLRRRRGAPVA